MNISLILAHPSPGSFNHAIAQTARDFFEKRDDTVYFHDLYVEKFDPILPNCEIPKDGEVDEKVQEYCKELVNSDAVILVHPNWWGQPPAILKGWVDRVIRPGTAYEFEETDSGEGVPVGLLKAKCAIVFNTSNTPDQREQEVFGDPLENLWKTCIFDFCGIKEFNRRMYNIICISTPEQRQKWLQDVQDTLTAVFA